MDNTFLKLTANPLMNLDHIYRYSGTKLVEPESLSSHITDVCMLGIKLIDECNYIAGYEFFDEKEFLVKAVYHDLEEAITGDVPRPLKYYNQDILHDMRDVADKIAKDFFDKHFYNSKESYQKWDDSKSGKEGLILKIVDTLCVVHKVDKEVVMLNNLYMLRVAHEVTTYIKELMNYVFSEVNDLPRLVKDYIINLLVDAEAVMNMLVSKYSSIMKDFNIKDNSMI